MKTYSTLMFLGAFFWVVVLYLQLVRRRRSKTSSEFDAFLVMMFGLSVINFISAGALHKLQAHAEGTQSQMPLIQFIGEHPILLAAAICCVLLGCSVLYVLCRPRD